MRFILLFFISISSLQASAQWWRVDLKFKKHERFAIIDSVTDHSISRLPVYTIDQPKIKGLAFDRSEESFLAAEYTVMKSAQHNMRFRVYYDASYDFSDLAHLYIQQNRFSEAKWFLLQSNAISRQQNDDKHTISNLMDLALIKAYTGDYLQAGQDLAEAHNIAVLKSLQEEIVEIDQMGEYIRQNKLTPAKPILRYADAPLGDTKTNERTLQNNQQ